MILGITGGIGCGKSTAARLFGRRGFRHLDSDALVREQVLTSDSVITSLRARYGDGVFGADGVVNRAALAEKVFGDDEERRWLEGLTHPMVFELWRAALRPDLRSPALREEGGNAAEKETGGANWAVETPLLFENSLQNWFDFTVCVACAPDQQLARLEQRGLNRALAGQRISKQLPLARKIELSDFVLWNEGSPEFLQAQVDRLVDSLAA